MSEALQSFADRPDQEGITMERLTHVQEDVLGDLLQSLRLHSTLYCRTTMGAPWGFGVAPRAVASFHLVTQGSCWLTVEGMDTPVLLTEGDLVILPHGHAHTLTDHPTTPVTWFEDPVPKQSGAQVRLVTRGGQGAVTTLVCGGLQLEERTTNPLFSILPPVLRLSSQQGQAVPWLQAMVQLVQAEANANQLAAAMVITRCSEILFLQAVREYLRTDGEGKVGWYRALQDPQIGQALALIQHRPDEPWTVESLARHVSLSRSAFSAKFKQLVGESPMQYLTRVRLTKAATLLRTHTATLVEIALAIGYDSEVAFSKAFKRYFGMAPGSYRQGRHKQTAKEDSDLRIANGSEKPQLQSGATAAR